MAFTQQAAKTYRLASPGVVRTWMFGSGNGAATGLAITGPQAIFVECYGSSFDSGTVTIQFATDNNPSTFAALTTVSVTFTANGVAIIANADTKTGFYRPNLTGTAGTASNLVVNLVAVGAIDVT